MHDIRTIGQHFEIRQPDQSLLGRGGMGEVYRGIDRRTGEAVAIKLLKSTVVKNNAGLASLARGRDQG